ncbi:hypothetical protein ACO2Q3_07650 [Caulobacter sp. KR2-114]|uniref:hypothetical protein n=1 Tax=Caulobacter sp. KR2-114 TaxID=3400912 RepID=UPI003BFA9C14
MLSVRLILRIVVVAALLSTSSRAMAREASGDALSFSLASSLPEREVIDRAFRSYARRFTSVGKIMTRPTPGGPQLASLELYGPADVAHDPWMCSVEVLHATFEPVRNGRDGDVQLQGFAVQERYHANGPITDFRPPAASETATAARGAACARLDPASFFASDWSGSPSFDLYALGHPDKLLTRPPGLDLASLDLSKVRDIHHSGPVADVSSTWIVFDDRDRDLVVREDRNLRSDEPAKVTFDRRPRDEWRGPAREDFAGDRDQLPAACPPSLTLEQVRRRHSAATIQAVFQQIACTTQHVARPEEPRGMVYLGDLLDKLSFATQPRRTVVPGLCSYEQTTMFFGRVELYSRIASGRSRTFKAFIDTPVPPYRLVSTRLYRRMASDCARVSADDRFFVADSAVTADRALLALDRAATAITKADRFGWMSTATLSFVSIGPCRRGTAPCVHAVFQVGGTSAAKPDVLLVDVPIRAPDDPTPAGDITVEPSWGPIA